MTNNIKLRNSAKAIIIRDNNLLCTKHKDIWGIYYLLPGGGLHPGENLVQALKRECMEELSIKIDVGRLRFIREYIGKNHEFMEYDFGMHQVEFMFICDIVGDGNIKMGYEPDSGQIGYEWLPLMRLGEYRIYPSKLRDVISEDGFIGGIYLGDVN